MVSDEACIHAGTALWQNHWEAWCGECGVTMRFPDLISLRLHAEGEVYEA
jgi:hypothetical protein